MKTCTKCEITKSKQEFHKSPKSEDGLFPNCKECRHKTYRADYIKNPEKYIKKGREWAKKNPEKHCESAKRAYRKNPEAAKRRHRNWHERNKEYHNGRNAQWKRDNIELVRAYNANKRADKLNRTPIWAELDLIKEFYKKCPKGYHVDHILPLKGKTVSGLHVIADLQYLTAEENLRKHNKLILQNEFVENKEEKINNGQRSPDF